MYAIRSYYGITKDNPLHTDDPHNYKGVHHGGKNVFRTNHTAVEKRQAGGHEQNQRGVITSYSIHYTKLYDIN